MFGDGFHAPVQITHPEWGSVPDTDTAAVTRARARLVGELEQPGTLGFGIHFGDQVFGRVVRNEAGEPVWEPLAAEFVRSMPRVL
jgi:hypothetical protein